MGFPAEGGELSVLIGAPDWSRTLTSGLSVTPAVPRNRAQQLREKRGVPFLESPSHAHFLGGAPRLARADPAEHESVVLLAGTGALGHFRRQPRRERGLLEQQPRGKVSLGKCRLRKP